jgi:hypothetical protein
MAFPASPTNGQIHSIGDRSWSWNSTLGAWKRLANSGTVNWQQYFWVRNDTNYSYTQAETPKDVGLNLEITLGDAANKVLIMADVHGCEHAMSDGITPYIRRQWLNLYRNGVLIAYLFRSGIDASAPVSDYSMTGLYIDTPGSVGPHVYSVKPYLDSDVGNSGSINAGTSIGSTLLLAEVKA